ncbi:hypothetical protein BDY24DRAFT_156737 [Mrakia frigida]|uniref:uncharacterized protein n=1 Tax=Mrakia frigida TaxID=29902 RepID=UPI003FCBFE1A
MEGLKLSAHWSTLWPALGSRDMLPKRSLFIDTWFYLGSRFKLASNFFKRRPTKEKTDGEATDMEDASTSKMGAAGGSDLSSALHGDLEKGRPTPSDTDMDSGGGWVGGLGAVGKGKGRGEGSSGEGWGSSRRSSFSAMSDVEPSAHLPYTGFGPYSASTTMGSAGNDVSGFKKGGSSRGKTELVCSPRNSTQPSNSNDPSSLASPTSIKASSMLERGTSAE